MPRENLRKTGSQMEEAAVSYLAERGVTILERNFRSRTAEIDIIGKQDGTILFIEVKARAESHKSGTAQEAVGIAKQKRICRCADYYLHTKGIDPYRASIRFDVVAITMHGETAASSEETAAMPEKASAKVKETKEENQSAQEEKKPEIRWLQNAFDYIPYGTGKPHWRVW